MRLGMLVGFDEVAVGWPARAGQIAYALFPRPTEHLVGALARSALRRAEPAPHSQGALIHPVARGTGVSGGLRERKGVPSARRLSQVGLVMAGAAVLLLGTSAAAYGRHTRDRNRR